jgi:hypothetical protein
MKGQTMKLKLAFLTYLLPNLFTLIILITVLANSITNVSASVIEDSRQSWGTNSWAGYYIYITSGDGSVQIRRIISNTPTTITISPAFDNIPACGSGLAIRRGYRESSQGLKLKLYMQYNDANRTGGKLDGYSCRIQASDSTAVEFVSVEKGSELGNAWTPGFYAPPGQGRINWLVVQFPPADGLPSGLYNIATITFNLRKIDINKPITFYVTNCPDGGLPIGITMDRYSLRFDTTTNDIFSGREEIIALKNTFENEQLIAETPSLLGSYPNPFNPTTTIRYELVEYSEVRLVIYDILGRMVSELVNSHQYEGMHSIGWEPHNISSGTYFVRLSIQGSISNHKEFKTLKLAYAR